MTYLISPGRAPRRPRARGMCWLEPTSPTSAADVGTAGKRCTPCIRVNGVHVWVWGVWTGRRTRGRQYDDGHRVWRFRVSGLPGCWRQQGMLKVWVRMPMSGDDQWNPCVLVFWFWPTPRERGLAREAQGAV